MRLEKRGFFKRLGVTLLWLGAGVGTSFLAIVIGNSILPPAADEFERVFNGLLFGLTVLVAGTLVGVATLIGLIRGTLGGVGYLLTGDSHAFLPGWLR